MAKEKILIVDDEETIRRLCLKIFKEKEYIPVEAGSTTDALDLAKAEMFDLVLVDMRMPGMNGLHLIQQIREIQK